MKSKTLYLSTFLFLFVVYQANAQDFKSGLRLGVNAAQINGDGMGGFNKAGFVGGLFVRYDFSQRVSGQFEMLYSGKGSKRTYHPDYGWSPGDWNDLRLHYIEVPVIANIKLIPKIAVQVGLGGAYLFGAKLEPINDTEFLRKYELSATGGVTYQLRPKLSLFARYTNSILSIGKTIPDPNRQLNYLGTKISLVASFGINYHFIAEKNDVKPLNLKPNL
ncbi:MAG: porin family protein [Bacteroidia bacterium]